MILKFRGNPLTVFAFHFRTLPSLIKEDQLNAAQKGMNAIKTFTLLCLRWRTEVRQVKRGFGYWGRALDSFSLPNSLVPCLFLPLICLITHCWSRGLRQADIMNVIQQICKQILASWLYRASFLGSLLFCFSTPLPRKLVFGTLKSVLLEVENT